MTTDRKSPKSPRELEDLLDEDVLVGPIELAHEELRAAGLGLAKVGTRGAAIARDALERRRKAWRVTAQARLRRADDLATRHASVPTDRDALLREIAAARSNPRFANQIEMAFRDRRPEEADIEELAGLLEDIRLLETLESEDE
jgi:hypothetical protein